MAILLSGKELRASVSEIVGYKSGVILSTDEMKDLLAEHETVSMLDGDGFKRLYSTDIEQLVADLLFKVGNIDNPTTIPQHILMFHAIKDDPNKVAIYEKVMKSFVAIMKATLANSESVKDNKIDPTAFLIEAAKLGKQGVEMAENLLSSANHQMHISPWGKVRRLEYKDPVKLKDLFESSSLEAEHGSYIDQRFIDYLHQNFFAIDDLHWRKFEGLTAEFFEREGFRVEIGPGRDDGGVDIRVYKESKEASDPEVILVQCKRTKSKVGRTVVKALWADVVHEDAESGLIVTTSAISPGAKQDLGARGYPIEEADRDTVKKWIEAMKTPNTGVFMGE